MAEDRIVAVGLLTQREVELLGHGFSRLWPVDETPCFSDLLRAIDQADQELRGSSDAPRESEHEIQEQHSQAMPGDGRY